MYVANMYFFEAFLIGISSIGKIARTKSKIFKFGTFVSEAFVACDQSDGQGRCATVASIGIRNSPPWISGQHDRGRGGIRRSNQNGIWFGNGVKWKSHENEKIFDYFFNQQRYFILIIIQRWGKITFYTCLLLRHFWRWRGVLLKVLREIVCKGQTNVGQTHFCSLSYLSLTARTSNAVSTLRYVKQFAFLVCSLGELLRIYAFSIGTVAIIHVQRT